MLYSKEIGFNNVIQNEYCDYDLVWRCNQCSGETELPARQIVTV